MTEDRPAGTSLATGAMDAAELADRLQRPDVGRATLDGLQAMADRLCSEYSFMPGDQLLADGRAWLRRIIRALDRRLSPAQHREILVQAGWIALLTGCVEYDTGAWQAAQATRQVALSLGTEAGHPEITAWAHEMAAWFALTAGDYRQAIAAARAGSAAAPHHSAAVQLAAQEAKAWARMGDRQQTVAALGRARGLLEAMPGSASLRHHFVVDPAKIEFYAMDCHRMLGDDKLAGNLAEQVIQGATGPGGAERAPMRIAEARITLGVVAARRGDIDEAVRHGERALAGRRTSLPALVTASQELARILRVRHPAEPATRRYAERLRALVSEPVS